MRESVQKQSGFDILQELKAQKLGARGIDGVPCLSSSLEMECNVASLYKAVMQWRGTVASNRPCE